MGGHNLTYAESEQVGRSTEQQSTRYDVNTLVQTEKGERTLAKAVDNKRSEHFRIVNDMIRKGIAAEIVNKEIERTFDMKFYPATYDPQAQAIELRVSLTEDQKQFLKQYLDKREQLKAQSPEVNQYHAPLSNSPTPSTNTTTNSPTNIQLIHRAAAELARIDFSDRNEREKVVRAVIDQAALRDAEEISTFKLMMVFPFIDKLISNGELLEEIDGANEISSYLESLFDCGLLSGTELRYCAFRLADAICSQATDKSLLSSIAIHTNAERFSSPNLRELRAISSHLAKLNDRLDRIEDPQLRMMVKELLTSSKPSNLN